MPTQRPTLVDGDLTLRPWVLADAADVYQACQDPVIQLYTTVPVPYTAQDAEQFVASRGSAEIGDDLGFAMVHEGRLAGSMSLHHIQAFDHIAELGYWITPGMRGRGLASRGARLLCDYGFGIGLRRITALVLPENDASRRTALAAGFELETIHRDAMTRRDGSQSDAVVFAKFPRVNVAGR